MAARLSFDERCVISAMVGVGASAGQIADELGCHLSTVRREINRAGGRGVYRAEDAQTEAEVRARRPKVPKLVTDPQLAEAVTQRLGMGWSPHAVAADLRNEGSLLLVCAKDYLSGRVTSRAVLGAWPPAPGGGYRAVAGGGSHAAAVNRQNATNSVTSDPSVTVLPISRNASNPVTGKAI